MATDNEPEQGSLPFTINKPLPNVPEIADRYVKTYTDSGTPKRDPKSFSLKPPAWRQWTDDRYLRLIDFVRANVDVEPFAQQEGISCEEVQHLFTYTFCDSMYGQVAHVRQAAKRRMVKHMQLVAESGTPTREWTEKGRKGELSRVQVGEIVVITPEGNKVSIDRSKLTKKDLAYLKEELEEQQWTVLQTEKQGKKRRAEVLDE